MRLGIFAGAILLANFASAHENHHFMQIPAFESAYPPERVVAIPFGQTVAMPSGDIDLLWIEGTCVAPKDADLSLKVREIVVAPGGHLDMGTQASPVLGDVTITFADGEFTSDDPDQWGHGLLVFGKFDCWGKSRQSWIEDAATGAGWEESDVLMYPDTRPCGPNPGQKYRRGLSAAGVDNGVVGPISVNTSHNIVFRSENPSGTRGHTLFSDRADISIGNAAFVGLGRTKPERLSATNLIGRYPIHFHHLIGPEGGASNGLIKNVFVDGLDYSTKWGLTVHATSWVRVEDCVVTRTAGAGIVTENGQEVGNSFKRNLAFDIPGGAIDFPTDVHEGFQGCGFWFKGMAQHIDDNIAMNCKIGFQSAINRRDSPSRNPSSIPELAYQTAPGGAVDGAITEFQSTLSGKNNRFVCNNVTGYDAWGSSCDIRDQPSPVFDSLRVVPIQWDECSFAFNGASQALHTFTQSATLFRGCEFLSSYNYKYGSESSIDYRRVVYFDGCLFDGMAVGVGLGRGAIVQGCIFNTPVSIELDGVVSQQWPYGVTIESNVHSGQPLLFKNTQKTLDDIQPHQMTIDEVYAEVAQFRESIGVVIDDPDDPDPDPNAAERERLQQEIASVQAQIVSLQSLLADLQSQLDALN